jgi:tRNA(adenine34) deaminase
MADQDDFFMRAAIAEAHKAYERQEVPVGAVVVCNDIIIARAHNLTETLKDPTAHAEMQAITAAAGYLGGKYLTDCIIYVTLEPCIMCASALGLSQIHRLVYGADDEKKGYTTLSGNVLHPKTIVTTGVRGGECRKLLLDFFKTRR